MRLAGILLALSALPSRYGIGDLGDNAYQFIDIIHKMGFKVWQVLPVAPLGYGNSPYQPYSSNAGDDIYISIDNLISDGLLKDTEVHELNPNKDYVDYSTVRKYKHSLYKLAFNRFKQHQSMIIQCKKFVHDNIWVINYAVFSAFKKINQNQSWPNWSYPYQNWIIDKSSISLDQYTDEINYEIFLQYIFFKQWHKLKQYANNLNIKIMGDIPIYVGLDSVDVWENQDIFLLNKNKTPSFIAGVPPDFFSSTGQLWGNPIYDWSKLEATGFKYWIKRLKANMQLFDIIRIDHFRAFDTYWKIPGNSDTAINGEWVEAPGYKLFDTIYRELPNINIVVEDLGELRDKVYKLRDHYKLCGMLVFQFHYKLENAAQFMQKINTILYSGTHDNTTLIDWFDNLDKKTHSSFLTHFNVTNNYEMVDKVIEALLNSNAQYVIFPVQDILKLDHNARFNTPGQIGSPNWEWKLRNFDDLINRTPFILEKITKSNR